MSRVGEEKRERKGARAETAAENFEGGRTAETFSTFGRRPHSTRIFARRRDCLSSGRVASSTAASNREKQRESLVLLAFQLCFRSLASRPPCFRRASARGLLPDLGQFLDPFLPCCPNPAFFPRVPPSTSYRVASKIKRKRAQTRISLAVENPPSFPKSARRVPASERPASWAGKLETERFRVPRLPRQAWLSPFAFRIHMLLETSRRHLAPQARATQKPGSEMQLLCLETLWPAVSERSSLALSSLDAVRAQWQAADLR